jgi:hypothetical protein
MALQRQDARTTLNVNAANAVMAKPQSVVLRFGSE